MHRPKKFESGLPLMTSYDSSVVVSGANQNLARKAAGCRKFLCALLAKEGNMHFCRQVTVSVVSTAPNLDREEFHKPRQIVEYLRPA
jgi:hypothetical protein